MEQRNVQDYLIEDLLETSDDNEMIQVLDFIRTNGVPLTQAQAQAMFLLSDADIEDVGLYVQTIRAQMTPISSYFKMTDKLTLADRIKGNAKLSNLLKANANPANSASIPMGIEKGVK